MEIEKLSKKNRYRWKRMRRRLHGKPNPSDYKLKKKQLSELFTLEVSGFLEIYFADESGFSLTPSVPYGWQKVSETESLATQRSAQLNVFGLLTRGNKFQSYMKIGSNTSASIISYIDDFTKIITKRTVIVLDNAPIHKSREFLSKIEEWRILGLYIFFLPTYSPHLNLIETLWRKMKYEWLKPADYSGMDNLTQAVEKILVGVGTEYLINFECTDCSINYA